MLKKFPENGKEKKRGLLLFKFASLCAERGLDDTYIFVMLRHIDSQTAWRKYIDRPSAERCYINIIARVREKTPYKSKSEKAGEGFRIVGFLDHFKEREQVPWLIENWIAEKSINLFLGESGVGKTMLVHDLCMKLIVREQEILNFKCNVEKPLTFLYFSYEMNDDENEERYAAYVKRYNQDQIARIHDQFKTVYPEDGPMRWCNGVDQAKIFALVEELKPDVVFIDSASMSFAPSMNEEKEVKTSVTFLKNLRDRFDFTAFVIHHPRKSVQGVRKEVGVDSSMGSQALINQATTAVRMDRKETETGEEITLTNIKNRRAKMWGTIRIEVDDNFSFARPTIATLPAAQPKELPVGRPTGKLAQLGEDIRTGAKKRGGRRDISF